MNVGSESGPAGWQDAEVAAASLPDKRLQRRLRRLLDSFPPRRVSRFRRRAATGLRRRRP
ncbi:transposase DNA-binding-containing protein [Bradyrhizobium sp. ISRA464]|uniref:transposase DNA-binding-containing protein n=1 Tax=Bradyrhizobium sp. ISRA464 TaxID=2866200 RepID=UPI0024799571|nr:transposase DNA-binding-containing protein [Bradyrhizobium sp. ISRA464]WGS26028.1 hypothetical protein MTX19_30420 [Bradyrhizobium sp. ISRA464]